MEIMRPREIETGWVKHSDCQTQRVKGWRMAILRPIHLQTGLETPMEIQKPILMRWG